MCNAMLAFFTQEGLLSPMMELHVCNQNTGDIVRKFAIGDVSELLIGRDSDCDIRIRSASISREHCIIEQDDSGAMLLRDSDSTGGTYVEGIKIDAVRIEDGLIAVIGPAVLKFYDAEI
jgi:pSer/pThr/pTyr-binding forkhead associated (FHA) protein